MKGSLPHPDTSHHNITHGIREIRLNFPDLLNTHSTSQFSAYHLDEMFSFTPKTNENELRNKKHFKAGLRSKE